MKRARVILMIGVVIACGSAAVAETVGTHKVYLPGDIKWGRRPPRCRQEQRRRCCSATRQKRACSRFESGRQRTIASRHICIPNQSFSQSYRASSV